MKHFIVLFSIVITIYGALNTYIGIRGWQAFSKGIPQGYGKFYWLAFTFLAISYFVGRIGDKVLPGAVSRGLTLIGAYWLIFIYYGVIILLILDLIRLLDRGFPFIPAGLKPSPATFGLIVVGLLIGILVYGTWNARNPVFRHYALTIPKSTPDLSALRVIVVSDIHLGNIVHNGRLTRMINQINERNPDLVLLPGDIIDEDIGPFIEQKMPETFQQLHPKYGVYAVFGNHEYIGGHAEEALYYLSQAGVTVLRDDYVQVADSFYLVGRDDPARQRHAQKSRQDLKTIMEGIDYSLPIILLDHQPFNLEEAQAIGVDLQLSGHTHRGQFFPNNLITQKIFEIDWGYLRKDTLQVIVSCGFGTWGPPVRIGNTPEVVDLVIHFL
ncbi:MAG: metallophosphoesterase [Syntrophomonadaceae bacterium]|nr:metallophosphoesterase [Syntrophomonadaceae bacterium]